jgi:hypothetical protein
MIFSYLVYYCARRDRIVHQRMNANGFIAIWFILLKQSKQGGEIQNMMLWNIIAVYIQNGHYLQWLHTLCTMGPSCHARLFFQSSWSLHESVAPSSAADQLLILLPAWRARPSPIPPSQVDPISLRVQAPSRSFVGYNYYLKTVDTLQS